MEHQDLQKSEPSGSYDWTFLASFDLKNKKRLRRCSDYKMSKHLLYIGPK